jgi:transketolase
VADNSKALAAKIRMHALAMTNAGNSSHVGSVLGMSDILGVLYSGALRVEPENPRESNRDRFILSKGHAGAGVYAALYEAGFELGSNLLDHCADGSSLSGHVSHKNNAGVELSTGSLGHGLSVAAGIALGLRMRGSDARSLCLMSDGECDEGSVWEAALFSAHHRLGNLTVIVDYNKLQSIDSIENTLGLEPFALKWEAFGWDVVEVDGHDHDQLHQTLGGARLSERAPLIVIAHTVKGKGVSFMENSVLWHYRSPQGEEFELAKKEIAAQL